MAEELLQCIPETGIVLHRILSRLRRRQSAYDVVSPRRRTKGQEELCTLKVAHLGQPVQETLFFLQPLLCMGSDKLSGPHRVPQDDQTIHFWNKAFELRVKMAAKPVHNTKN